nr:IS4 family transposase [Aquisalimonas sp.]
MSPGVNAPGDPLRQCWAGQQRIAWRVMLLRMTARRCPDLPCEVAFETEAWHAIYIVSQHTQPPDEPPPLDTIVRMLAGFGGLLNRKHDGPPGNKSIWIGLQRTRDFVLALAAYNAAGP